MTMDQTAGILQVPLKTGQFPTSFVRQCRVAHHYYYAVISVLQPIIYPDAGFLDLLWIPTFSLIARFGCRNSDELS